MNYNRLAYMLKSFLGGRSERLYTILQTFPACDLDGIKLINEPVIDSQTHGRIKLSKAEAEIRKHNYPQGRVVPFTPYKNEKSGV